MKSNSIAMMFTLLVSMSCKTMSNTDSEQKSIDATRTVCVSANLKKDNPLIEILESVGSPMYTKFGSFHGVCGADQSYYEMYFSDNLVNEFLKKDSCYLGLLSDADRDIIVRDRINGGIAGKGRIVAGYCYKQNIFEAINYLPSLK